MGVFAREYWLIEVKISCGCAKRGDSWRAAGTVSERCLRVDAGTGAVREACCWRDTAGAVGTLNSTCQERNRELASFIVKSLTSRMALTSTVFAVPPGMRLVLGFFLLGSEASVRERFSAASV